MTEAKSSEIYERVSALPQDYQTVFLMILYGLSGDHHAVALGREAFPELRGLYNETVLNGGSREHYERLYWPEEQK